MSTIGTGPRRNGGSRATDPRVMLLSKSCEYAMRTALHLAGTDGERLTPIKSISEELGIPYHFLAKVAQALIAADILRSERGPTGGVELARDASEISLKHIVLAIDGPGIFTECVLGLPECGHRQPCPLHDSWAPARNHVEQMFQNAMLDDMARRIKEGDLRLSALLKMDDPNAPAA